MVDTQTTVECEDVEQCLSEIYISRYFVGILVGDICGGTILVVIPCPSEGMHIVEPDCGAVAFQQTDCLIPVCSPHLVVRTIQICFRRSVDTISVVDLMITPVIIQGEGTRCATVIVRERCRSHTSGDMCVVVYQRTAFCTWVRRIETGDIEVGAQFPRRGQLVCQFRISRKLVEVHITPMSVGTVVFSRQYATEPTCLEHAGIVACHRTERSGSKTQMIVQSVVPLFARDDVDDTPHGVGTVED